jgi:hypothetical protein
VLAFGLGGREVAAQMLGDAYDKGREQKGQVKDDMETGKYRAKDDARQVKAEAEARTGAGNGDIDKPSGPQGVRPLR